MQMPNAPRWRRAGAAIKDLCPSKAESAHEEGPEIRPLLVFKSSTTRSVFEGHVTAVATLGHIVDVILALMAKLKSIFFPRIAKVLHIAGPAQVVGVYVGLAMKEQYWSLKSYPVCFAALNSFMNILDEVNKNVSAGQGAMNNLSQLEKSYLRERKLCEAELH